MWFWVTGYWNKLGIRGIAISGFSKRIFPNLLGLPFVREQIFTRITEFDEDATLELRNRAWSEASHAWLWVEIKSSCP